jgi:TetR/AcrR family transcriptional regulator, fatty acid metabolism regulator protein
MNRPTSRSVAVQPLRTRQDRFAKMPKPDPTEQSRSRRERILDAAFHAFSTRGYRDTAVDDIAGAAETSKGGIYFHFPTKEAIFRELMDTTADKLVGRVERAVALQTEPVARAEAAIHTVLTTFAGHRTMARLLFLDTMGAGRVFQAETNALHARFAALVQGYLDDAVTAGAVPPLDTRLTAIAWFGAINEVVARWLLADDPARLEDAYPGLRAALLRSAGVPEARIGDVPLPTEGWAFPEVGR